MPFAVCFVASGAEPNPVLNSVFPAGGQAGTTFEVTVAGDGLDAIQTFHCSHPGIAFEVVEGNRFLITIPEEVTTGSYDLQAVTAHGLSSARTFIAGNRPEFVEEEPNDSDDCAQPVSLDVVVNGRIETGGDLDRFAFTAKKDQRVVIECRAERIDSTLRAVLELYDDSGRRLAVNRGYFRIDPLIDFHVPEDGTYVVKVFDLVYSGSTNHTYRLEIDTGPRVAFAVPNVVERGRTTRVMLYGWNLARTTGESDADTIAVSGPPAHTGSPIIAELDRVDVDVTPPADGELRVPLRRRSSQLTVDEFAWHYPGAHAPIAIGVTDVPVVRVQPDNNLPAAAEEIPIPCEVSGRLAVGEERDWFAIEVRRGEVLWFEAFGDRIDSPVDLDVSVFDASAETELAHFGDETANVGGRRFPSSHSDPLGRWTVPADGRYLLMIRNLIGGLDDDPRRVYRLSVRREEPDVDLALVPRHDGPAAIDVQRGGRQVVDVLACRRRGLNGPIRVTATNLPPGIDCPEIWLGPGVNRAPLVLSASDSMDPFVGTIDIVGRAESVGEKRVRGGTVVRGGLPNGWSRLTDHVVLSAHGDAPLRITADGHETRNHHLYGEMQVRHSPGSILDVAVHVERRIVTHQAPVRLIGIGVPGLIRNQIATIPAGEDEGHISFYLPPTLPVGTYTIAVQGETTVALGDKDENGEQPTESVTVFSNPVTFDVEPAAFIVEVDPYAPQKIRRGEIVQVAYQARRINGFIGKIHTELYAAETVNGLRGRGVTFVGQTETGSIQVIANDDAPLGQQPFLRLYGVGVIEDQPVFHGSCFLELEVVE